MTMAGKIIISLVLLSILSLLIFKLNMVTLCLFGAALLYIAFIGLIE